MGAVDCEKHRTISITSQVAKIVLKVIDERLKSKVEETTDDAQFGFRRRKSTRNAIFVLRMIMERAIEKQKDLYMCFVDFEKAFDRVRHELLIDRLNRVGADEADVRLLTNLYWEQKDGGRVWRAGGRWRVGRGRLYCTGGGVKGGRDRLEGGGTFDERQEGVEGKGGGENGAFGQVGKAEGAWV